MKDFRDLKVWEISHKLVLGLYKICKYFPKNEEYGLKSQLLRAATSIPTNLSEGCSSSSQKEFKRYVQIALASSGELAYLMLLSFELKYIDEATYSEYSKEIAVIGRMLNNLRKALTNS